MSGVCMLVGRAVVCAFVIVMQGFSELGMTSESVALRSLFFGQVSIQITHNSIHACMCVLCMQILILFLFINIL